MHSDREGKRKGGGGEMRNLTTPPKHESLSLDGMVMLSISDRQCLKIDNGSKYTEDKLYTPVELGRRAQVHIWSHVTKYFAVPSLDP